MSGIKHSIFRICTLWGRAGLLIIPVIREDSEVIPLEHFEHYDITVERFFVV